MIKSGVYQILNIINNKRYVGSTISFVPRWNLHKRLLRKGIHHSVHLQNAWNKDGENSFIFKVLEYVPDLDSLETNEQQFTDLLNPEYSIRKKCVGSQLGLKRSAKQNQKNSERNKIRLENKENHPMYGKRHSDETRRKQSESHTGKVPGNKGKKMSEETKKSVSKGVKQYYEKIHSKQDRKS